MFDIKFIQKPKIEYGELVCRGRITLGDFTEEFNSPIVFWTEDEYRKQWHQAAQRIIDDYRQSCFVTAIRNRPLMERFSYGLLTMLEKLFMFSKSWLYQTH